VLKYRSNTSLAHYIKWSQDPSWKGFLDSFRKTSREIKLTRSHIRGFSRRSMFVKLSTAYMNILWPDLSIDLVAACLRQRIYTNIVITECQSLETAAVLSTAAIRYHKFLFLLGKRGSGSSKRSPIVPTLDIDLCWHTHQLFPYSYHI